MSFLSSVNTAVDIPDSAIHRRNATLLPESDTEIVDPWEDEIGSVDFDATGDPSLSEAAVNGVDAVDLDGNDGYDYDPNLSGTVDEPVTLMWALNVRSLPNNGIVNLWRDAVGVNEILYRTDTDNFLIQINSNSTSGGSPATGDQIVTLTVSSDNGATLRINGSNIVSLSSGNIPSGQTILDGSNSGSYYYSYANNGQRYLDALPVEDVVHNDELSGTALTDEEKRLEVEANMSVL